GRARELFRSRRDRRARHAVAVRADPQPAHLARGARRRAGPPRGSRGAVAPDRSRARESGRPRPRRERGRAIDPDRKPLEQLNMSRKILIIDDDNDIRVGLNVRLRASGYTTAFAADGAGAIRVARKEQPDLILLDLGLPAGDGFQVLERLKVNTELSHIPVIVLSARDAEANERRAVKAGASAYFQKPVDDGDLLEAISSAIS